MKYNRLQLCLALFMFIFGGFLILVCGDDFMRSGGAKKVESLDQCPNYLIRQGDQIHLMNTSLDVSNAIVQTFNNIDEYRVYAGKTNDCPILYLQEEGNTQGDNDYRTYMTPFDPLPISPPPEQISKPLMPPPFALEAKSTMLHGFDSYGIEQGTYTSLDVLHDSTKSESAFSDNPMDDNWGGVSYTNTSLQNGKYLGSELYKVAYPLPLAPGSDKAMDSALSS